MEERAPSIPGDADDDDQAPAPPSTSANTRVACIAVINHNNGPLFFKVYKHVANVLTKRGNEKLEVKMQEFVYNSLDIIDERINSLKATPMKDNDGYLGCLSVVGAISLYGYMTNTRMKIVVGLKTSGASEIKDPSIKLLFRRLHKAVVTVYLNSFAPLDMPIKSYKFETKVDQAAERFG